MFAGLKAFTKDILTEDDANSVFCPVRVIGASGTLALIGNTIYMAAAHAQFDPMAFGTAIAAIAGAVGAGAGIKAHLGG
ncbi:MAG: hypothetical protein KGL35_08235 [Bradyrhizobium sp.]|nr:hypothetical protein [Bradyrhizobium sp.]